MLLEVDDVLGRLLTRLIIMEETTDVALAQSIEQGPSLWLATEHRKRQSELVDQLVLAYLPYIQTQLSYALVAVFVTRAASPTNTI